MNTLKIYKYATNNGDHHYFCCKKMKGCIFIKKPPLIRVDVSETIGLDGASEVFARFGNSVAIYNPLGFNSFGRLGSTDAELVKIIMDKSILMFKESESVFFVDIRKNL
jgi:hypothetical protein